MTDPRAVVLDAIVSVAPDVDRQEADQSDDLWYANDLDSMDQLAVMVIIAEKTGVEIPEADYPTLTSVEAIVTYLEAAKATPPQGSVQA